MKQLKRDTIIGIFVVLSTGTLAHFLYGWSGSNPVIGCFTPVNESVWEHMKLLFFPMLLYAFVMILRYKVSFPCITSSFCFGTLAGTLLIPILFYAYTWLLGTNILILDIGTFVLSTLFAFFLALRLTQSCRLVPFTPLICLLTGILFLSFLFFTFCPPDLAIFYSPES